MLGDYAKYKRTNILGIIINIIALEIVVYGLFKDPQTGTLFALGILIFIALYFIVSYPLIILKQRFNEIKINNLAISEIRKDLNKIKDNIDMILNTAKLDARLSFLEKRFLKVKNKKGQIDPRWILILIIIILLMLYLKSKGYF